MEHAYNPSYSGRWDRRIAWTWEAEVFIFTYKKYKYIYIHKYIYLCVCVCIHIYIFLKRWGRYTTHAGLKLQASSDPLASASQSAGITGVSHCTRPGLIFFFFLKTKVLLCCSDWPRTSGLKQSSCFSPLICWDDRHQPPHLALWKLKYLLYLFPALKPTEKSV